MLKIKAHFSAFYNKNLACSLCADPRSEETKMHLLMQDDVLGNELNQVKYEDAFASISKQKKVVQVFTKVMAVYEKNKAKESPGASTTSWRLI
jgi:hypothetical protein